MPRKSKIDLEKVLASLNTLCTQCGYSIPPTVPMLSLAGGWGRANRVFEGKEKVPSWATRSVSTVRASQSASIGRTHHPPK
jgi:hypothetical protein